MTKEVKLPEISEGAEMAVVSEIMVSKGDHVDESQPLIAVESDKATVEIPAEFAGTIKDIKVKEDDELKTGDVILVIEADSEKEEKEPGEDEDKDGEKDDEKGKAEVTAKAEDDNDDDKKESEGEKEDRKHEDKEPDPVEASEQKPDEKDNEKKERPIRDKDIPAAPLARKLARELEIDLEDVKERESKDQRITSNDIMQYVKHLLEGKEKDKTAPSTSEAGEVAMPDFSRWGETEKETLSAIRKATAKITSQSWRSIPHVTQFDEADVSNIEKFRKAIKKEGQLKISLTAVLIKLVAEGLKKFPKFNASVNFSSNEVIYKKYYNISIAVDTPKGLMMPVIKHVDRKSIESIAGELKELVTKAIDGKLDKEAMEGGNFAISNLGPIGGTVFTPIIFPPQVAILGVGGLKTIPRYNASRKKFQPRKMIPLALSYDHRLIDGADAARFTHWLCKTLENPLNVFVERGDN